MRGRLRGGHEGPGQPWIVRLAISALLNLEHRGATGAETNTGDGAGILVQMPDAFLREVSGFDLPAAGGYAAGMAFLPQDEDERAKVIAGIDAVATSEGLTVLGWRDVPFNDSMIGEQAREMMPVFRLLFISGNGREGMDLERLMYVTRKRIEHEVPNVYFPSLSSRTLVYKGMLHCPQLPGFFPDLVDPRLRDGPGASPFAVLHEHLPLVAARASLPDDRAQRRDQHAAGEPQLDARPRGADAPELIPGDIERIFPVITPGASDSASFDECLELLNMAGRSLPHAVLMMIPEAWENHAR